MEDLQVEQTMGPSTTRIPDLSGLETIVSTGRFMKITPISPPKQTWLRAFSGPDPECLLASRRPCRSRRRRERGNRADDQGWSPYIRCVPGPNPTTCYQPDQLWRTSQESTTTPAVECGTGRPTTQFRPVTQPDIVMFGSGSGTTAGPVPLPRLNGNPPQHDAT